MGQKLFEVWRKRTQVLFLSADFRGKKDLVEGYEKIHTILASSFNDAHRKYHEVMGWQPFVPSGNPEDDMEFDD